MVIRQKECALTEICIITNTVKYVTNTTVVRLDRCKYDLNLDTFFKTALTSSNTSMYTQFEILFYRSCIST